MQVTFIKTFLTLLILSNVNYSAFSQVKNRKLPLGTINGISVDRAEVQREMRRYRAQVYSLITNKHSSANTGNGIWEQKIDGLKGIDFLRKQAIDSLTTIKVQEKLLVDRGLWHYKNYRDFLKDLATTNENRKKLVLERKLMYGPIQYTEETFFDYRWANALIQLKQKLVEEKLISIAEIHLENQFAKMQKTVYKDEKSTLKTLKRQVTEAFVEDTYKVLIMEYSKKAKRLLHIKELNQITLNN